MKPLRWIGGDEGSHYATLHLYGYIDAMEEVKVLDKFIMYVIK